MNKEHIISSLPEFKGQYKLLTNNQDTDDIIEEILNKHDKTAKDYDLIAAKFWQGNNVNTAMYLFDFLKKNVAYKIEGTVKQSVKSPAAMLTEGYGDCKHYASFIVGVFEALKRQGKGNDVVYRFASYTRDKRPKHVFAVLREGGKEYFIDPVLSSFDKRNPMYNFKKDYKPGSKESIGELFDISGITTRHWTDDVYGNDQVGLSINPKLKGKVNKFVQGQKTNAQNAINFGKRNLTSAKDDLKKVANKGIDIAKAKAFMANRNAFLALLALNVFRYSTQLWQKGARDRNSNTWKQLAALWRKLGGNENKLWDAIKNGVDTYNRKHKQKISGAYSFVPDMYDTYFREENAHIGEPVTAASIAAILAAAAPVIAAFAILFKNLGINKDKGWVRPEDLPIPTNENGTPQDILQQGTNYASGDYLPEKFDNGIQTLSPDEEKSVFSDFSNSIKTFYAENKKPILWGAGILTALYVVPKVLEALPKTTKRRR